MDSSQQSSTLGAGIAGPQRKRHADDGHANLIADIKVLLKKALRFKYHDVKSKSPTPKEDLTARLSQMEEVLANGRYDNITPDEKEAAELDKVTGSQS